MSNKRGRPSRELHDAFENDVDLDIAPVTVGERVEGAPEIAEARGKEAPKKELIERIRPSEMIPDRFQPRPILPVEIHRRYYTGEIDCYGAAGEWLKLAERDKGHRDRVAELMAMADSVDEHGQIKPITGSWATPDDGRYVFQIETGERRFWGACLKSVSQGREEEPLLRVEAVDAPSVERQIVENRHAQPPTAVAQAREIAALLMSRMGHRPDPSLEDPYDYFRQALDQPGRERLPRGVWNKIEPVMQLTPRRMRQVLSVLQMPTELLEQADRYDLSDRVLQAVIAQPAQQWPALVQAAVEQGLTGEELTTAAVLDAARPTARPRKRAKTRDHPRSALRGLRGFSGALTRAGEKQRDEVLGAVADEVVVQEDAAHVVDMLEKLVALLRVRMEALEETHR
jgi:hypothetical protein